MKAITSAELLKLVSDLGDHAAHGLMVRRAVAEVFRLRRKITVRPPLLMHGGQVFTITQKFEEGFDPDKILAIFQRDLEKLSVENGIEARTTIPFSEPSEAPQGPFASEAPPPPKSDS